jgi:hypothetical protein
MEEIEMTRHPLRKIETTNDGYTIYAQAMKTTKSWQFSVRNPSGKLLGRTAAREILDRGNVQAKHGSFFQLAYVQNGGKWDIKVPRRA